MHAGDEVEDEYGNIMSDFVATASADVAAAPAPPNPPPGQPEGALCSQLRELQTQLTSLATFFGEDPKNFKPQDVLKLIGATAKEYDKANVNAKKAAERARQVCPPRHATP